MSSISYSRIVAVILIFFICSSYSVFALEKEKSGVLSIDELKLDDGMVIAHITLPESVQTSIRPITVGLFVHDASCPDAPLIGWRQVIPDPDSHVGISLYGHIPLGLTSENITVQVATNMNDKFPTLCSPYISPPKPLEYAVSSKQPAEMDSWYNSHTIETKSKPLYIIEDIIVSSDYMWVSPGSLIKPEVVVKNQGEDDTSPIPVQVDAYLGDRLLTPQEAQISPLMGGEKKTFTMSYSIPSDLDYGTYDLTMVLDPNLLTGKGDAYSGGGKISLSTPDDDSFIGCAACWAAAHNN
jgi:hypothetical protein